MSWKAHLAALTATLTLLALAFPRPGWWPLAYVALVPATLVAMRGTCGKRLIVWGWLTAFLWWEWMFRWMIPVTLPGQIAACAYFALYFPLGLFLLRKLHRHWQLPMTLALPMVWVSLEMVRSHWPSGGFAWFQLGHTQAQWQPSDHPPSVAQLASILGESGVSFFVAMVNGLIVDLLTRPIKVRRADGGVRFNRVMLALTLLVIASTILVLLMGTLTVMESVAENSPSMIHFRPRVTVAVIQTHQPQNNKEAPTPEGDAALWNELTSLTQRASILEPKPQLILWPETVIPAPLDEESLRVFVPRDPKRQGSAWYDRTLVELSKATGASLILGGHRFDWEHITRDGEAFLRIARNYNSVLLYTPTDGRSVQHYSKIHRVPFGEYIPWIESVPWLKDAFLKYLSPYDFDYTLSPGKSLTLFNVPGAQPATTTTQPGQGGSISVVTPICFEDTDAQLMRRMVLGDTRRKQADLIANLTNDGWFAGTDQPYQHLQIASLRSIENRVPSARSVNTGVSGFIDSTGRVISIVQANGTTQSLAGLDAQTLTLDSRGTWFGTWGNAPMWGMAIVTALAVTLAHLRPIRARVASYGQTRGEPKKTVTPKGDAP